RRTERTRRRKIGDGASVACQRFTLPVSACARVSVSLPVPVPVPDSDSDSVPASRFGLMPARTPALPSPSHAVSVPLSFFLCVLCVLCGELFFAWGEDAGAPELVSRSLRPCLSFFLCVLCGAL